MKKTIFIGSSSEALPIVNKVKELLKDTYDVICWRDSFTLNKSSLDCLIENAIKVDKAIFIGTADDKVIPTDKKRLEREGEKVKHRDNVVFEFGLFLGMLGRVDCIYLSDNESDLMTDYSGITTVFFDKREDKLDDSLNEAVEKIKTHFNDHSSNRDINLFPSTFLASAYFVNFIQPIFDHYTNNGCKIVTTNKNVYSDCEIIVVLPAKLSNDVNAQVVGLKQKVDTKQEQIECKGRPRNILVDASTSKGTIKIVDFPTILASLYHAVHALLPDEISKREPCYDSILAREVNRFIEALNLYIRESPQNIRVTVKQEDEVVSEVPAKKRKGGILGYFFRY